MPATSIELSNKLFSLQNELAYLRTVLQECHLYLLLSLGTVSEGALFSVTAQLSQGSRRNSYGLERKIGLPVSREAVCVWVSGGGGVGFDLVLFFF